MKEPAPIRREKGAGLFASKGGERMNKYNFAIVGSGWRTGYYIRIAKALPQVFELSYVLCRSQEKAESYGMEHGVKTTVSEDDVASANPDFVVVSVSKEVGPQIAMKWMDRGFTVLLETPAGIDLETLRLLWKRARDGQKLVVAEQYFRYPQNVALLKLLERGIIGERNCLNISLAHDYHGASLIRAFLGIPVDTGFTVTSKAFSFPTTETLTRYEEFKDGRVSDKKRRLSVFEFDNGKVAIYDFDSEEYRSPIRKKTFKLQGVRGEVIDNAAYFLNGSNRAKKEVMIIRVVVTETGSSNPNLKQVREIEKIMFGEETIYEAPFGICGLAEDETAIATLMKDTGKYARGLADSPYPIEEALQDAYMAIKMQEAEDCGGPVKSSKEVWM